MKIATGHQSVYTIYWNSKTMFTYAVTVVFVPH